jgi:translocator protein
MGLAGWLLLCYAAAAVGGFFQPGAWYDALAKPPWNPPDWIFGPVWTVLYGMMAVAAWLVWRRHGMPGRRAALGAFVVQLVLNVLWSALFFGLERPGLALVEIVVLWFAILVTLLLFWRVRPAAGALLVPYLLWVSFALALNFELWRLNPGA